MKTILFAVAFLIGPVSGEDQAIKPLVGSSFGEVFVITVEFVEKGKSYYQQNIVKEPWLSKVISINGVELKEPIVIEYLLVEDTATKGKNYAKGKKYEFMAYEDIETMGTPQNWEDENSQIPYIICQRLILKQITKKMKERLTRRR